MIQNQMKKSYAILLLIFLIAPVFNVYAQTPAFPKSCTPGYIQGNVPTTQVPDYDYTSDGFLEFHFRLTNPTWKYNFGQEKIYDQNCNLIVGGTGIFNDKKTSTWPGVSHLVLRYLDDIYPDYPHFNAFNGDTGASLPLDTSAIIGKLSGDNVGFLPSPSIRLIFGNRDPNNFSWDTETGDLISTPALPIRITPPVLSGASNILFLPGLMGSRLYEQGGSVDCGTVITGSECFFDKELWVSINDSNQADLTLDMNGKSINSVYTKNDTQNNGELDETGIVDDVYSANIYQSFINDLKNWKEERTIADYAFVPYDWRLSLDDVITNGGTTTNNNLSYSNSQDFSQSFILKQLEALQSNSKSGKVTIITHSNGGLVAKALVQKLKDTNNPLYDKIDKIIFVAVPQVGTPDAIAALLHGSELGPAGLIMERDRSRQLSENMSPIYNFLPSASYFTTVDPAFAVDKLVSFENKTFFDSQTSQYGVYVSNETELKNYILGTDGRTKPSFSDTVHPNIGNSNLYTQAENVHQILDSWQPSPDTKVIQVAGWGEETLAGLDYKTYRNKDLIETLSYKPRWVVDGDGTVVVPSALWMSDSNPNVERWWVDLKSYNTLANLKRIHKNMLEVSNLRIFIKSRIMNSLFTDQDKVVIDNISTLISSDSRLHYTLHSPLTLGITDTQGRYTGQDPITKEIKEEIPDVTYKQIGEVQFISAPTGIAYTLKMQGYQEGDFSLDLDKQEGNNITVTASFQGIPSSASTLVTMDITPSFEVSSSILKIDANADGIIDKILKATPELQITFNTNTKNVVLSAQDTIDPYPSIVTTKFSTTLTNAGGNTTIIPFTQFRENSTTLKFSYNKIIRNGITTTAPNTNILYDWQETKGVLTGLNTKITVRGVEKYVFSYRKANNVTIIKETTSAGTVTTTKPGFVVVTVKTDGDGLKVSY